MPFVSIFYAVFLNRQLDLMVRHFWQRARQEGKVEMNKLFCEMLECHSSQLRAVC